MYLQLIRRALIATVLISPVANTYASPDLSVCEPLDPALLTGPNTGIKYRDVNDPDNATFLGTVETNHFLPMVERLTKGQTSPLPYDIAFVLRQFPNHYRALSAMARWQLAHKLPDDPENKVWTVDCYFLRAISFRPSDASVRLYYGIYLHLAKRLDEATQQYAAAESLGDASASLYYNWGLLELDLQNLEKAKKYSDLAYQMGYPLPGLKQKLNSALARESAAAKSSEKSSASDQPASSKK